MAGGTGYHNEPKTTKIISKAASKRLTSAITTAIASKVAISIDGAEY